MRWYSLARFNHRTHRELLVIDGEIAFVGGAGVADWWWRPHKGKPMWRDMMARITGPVVSEYEPGMTHVKMLLVDDLWSVIGTTNLDNRSFEHNDEVNVAIRDEAVTAHHERFRARSHQVPRADARDMATAAGVGEVDRHRRVDSRTSAMSPACGLHEIVRRSKWPQQPQMC